MLLSAGIWSLRSLPARTTSKALSPGVVAGGEEFKVEFVAGPIASLGLGEHGVEQRCRPAYMDVVVTVELVEQSADIHRCPNLCIGMHEQPVAQQSVQLIDQGHTRPITAGIHHLDFTPVELAGGRHGGQRGHADSASDQKYALAGHAQGKSLRGSVISMMSPTFRA